MAVDTDWVYEQTSTLGSKRGTLLRQNAANEFCNEVCEGSEKELA